MNNDDITPAELEDFFKGLEGFMKDSSAPSVCPEPNCAVHYRNNLTRKERFGNVRITYVGDYAVYSYGVPDINAVAADKGFMARMEVAALNILTGSSNKGEVTDILNAVPTQAVTEIYRVGDGPLGDNPLEILREVVSGDVDLIHNAHVDLLAEGSHDVQ